MILYLSTMTMILFHFHRSANVLLRSRASAYLSYDAAATALRSVSGIHQRSYSSAVGDGDSPFRSSGHECAGVMTATQQHGYRKFTTAYGGTPGDGKHNSHLLAHVIPYRSTLKDGRRVEVDFFRHSPNDAEEDEWFAGMALMNLIIREGRSWPFDEDFENVESWSGYFLSHTAFVVRALDNGMDAAKRNSSSQGEVLGEKNE